MSPRQSDPLRAVQLTRHKWPGGLVNWDHSQKAEVRRRVDRTRLCIVHNIRMMELKRISKHCCDGVAAPPAHSLSRTHSLSYTHSLSLSLSLSLSRSHSLTHKHSLAHTHPAHSLSHLAPTWPLSLRVWGSGFTVWGLGFTVWGLGFKVWGLGFTVWGVGFGV